MNVNERFIIGTTRFNDETYKENLDWRIKHNHNGCIYPLNKKIADSIPSNMLICVLEMNNSQTFCSDMVNLVYFSLFHFHIVTLMSFSLIQFSTQKRV